MTHTQQTTVSYLQAFLNQQAYVRTPEGLLVKVKILDAKVAWGKTRLLVEPLAGSGQVWIDESRLNVTEAQK